MSQHSRPAQEPGTRAEQEQTSSALLEELERLLRYCTNPWQSKSPCLGGKRYFCSPARYPPNLRGFHSSPCHCQHQIGHPSLKLEPSASRLIVLGQRSLETGDCFGERIGQKREIMS